MTGEARLPERRLVVLTDEEIRDLLDAEAEWHLEVTGDIDEDSPVALKLRAALEQPEGISEEMIERAIEVWRTTRNTALGADRNSHGYAIYFYTDDEREARPPVGGFYTLESAAAAKPRIIVRAILQAALHREDGEG